MLEKIAAPPPAARILVVEDEGIVARDVRMQLQSLGYNPVGHASLGEEAIVMAGALRPDLVLMDIHLGSGMDGITAAQQVRSRFQLPVVFLTAFPNDDVLARAKLTEPFGYIFKPFSDHELHTVLEMALYKHQAERKLQTSAIQLQALARRVLEVQEAERRRIAVELHDELGQSLTAIKINLQAQMRHRGDSLSDLVTENIQIVDDALQQVRRLALGLRPSMLDDLGLAPALRWMADQMALRSGLALRFQADTGPMRLASDIETACFRIAQEALNNVARHANAKQVTVSLGRQGDQLALHVADDGKGFDLGAMRLGAQAGGSVGVLGMQERATLVGGQLAIRSEPGEGCTVALQCPWRAAEGAL